MHIMFKGGDMMCRKIKLWGYLLASLGVGVVVSGFISSILLRFLIGFALLVAGILLLNHR